MKDQVNQCTKANHYLYDYYKNRITNNGGEPSESINQNIFNYLELVDSFLTDGDVIYALSIIDIVNKLAEKALHSPLIIKEKEDSSKLNSFINAIRILKYYIEHDKDFVQNVKPNENLDTEREYIKRELISKIDGAIALAKEIGDEKFIQYAIDQCYFFQPEVVKARMDEIVTNYYNRDELYARRSAKILTDNDIEYDNSDYLRLDKGDTDKGDTGKGNYSQKMDDVRTAYAPIKNIADKVKEQADQADEAAKKAEEYANLVCIVVAALDAAVAAKKATASAVKKATKKDANAAKKFAIDAAIGNAMKEINKAYDAILGNQAINLEEIKSAAKDAKDAISAAKEAIRLKVSDADENTKKAAEAINKISKTVKKEIADATKAAANAAEKAAKEVTKIENVSHNVSTDAVDKAKKAANKVRLVAATNVEAQNAKSAVKAVADTAKKAAEAAKDAVNKAINSIKTAKKPNGNNREQSEAPSNKAGESDNKGKDSKYYLFNSIEKDTFVVEEIVDYPIIIDNDGNAEVRSLINKKTGYLVSAGKENIFQNYRISHVWGRAFDPRYFTNLWNIVIVPSWANDLLDKPNAINGSLESRLQSTIMKICKLLYFKEICVNTEHVSKLNMPGYPQVINEGDVICSISEISIPDKTITLKDTSAKDNTKPYLINIIEGKGSKTLGSIVKYAVYI